MYFKVPGYIHLSSATSQFPVQLELAKSNFKTSNTRAVGWGFFAELIGFSQPRYSMIKAIWPWFMLLDQQPKSE